MKIIELITSAMFLASFAISSNYLAELRYVENIANQYSTLIAHKGLLTNEMVDELKKEHEIIVSCAGKCSGSLGESIRIQFIRRHENNVIKYEIIVERYITLGFKY